MHAQFTDKVVFITGAASGFGKLLAEQLALQSAKLFLVDQNSKALQEVRQSLKHLAEVNIQTCDVTREDQVKSAVDKTVEHFSQLDIAVNNAGGSTKMNPLIDTEEQDLDFNFALNAKSAFFGMKYQIPYMIQQGGGSILNVSSMAGIGGAPKLTAYCAAKHAVVGMSKTAAVEYARKNVRVNVICPFYSPTPLIKDEPPELLDQLAGGAPMKRLGLPEEIVAAMLSIISPANSYMTGQAIAVDGGVSAY